MNRTGEISKPNPIVDDFGTTAEWYLTVRCASAVYGQLIAFQKATYPGDHPNLRLAITGEPSVLCPHCKLLMRFQVDQIERHRVVLTQ